jgi:hypothetical protein
MSLDPRDAEKLIGGYATGTLSEAERNALFAEALNNQTLFDALANEEALRELLADPVARRQLLATLEKKPESALQRFSAWFFRPLTMGVAAGVAAAGLAVVIVPKVMDRQRAEEVAVYREAPSATSTSQPVPEQAPQTPPAAQSEAPPAPKIARRQEQAPRGALGRPDERDRGGQPAAPAPPAPAAQTPPAPAATPEPKADTASGAREVRVTSEREGGRGPVGVVGGVPAVVTTPVPAEAPRPPAEAPRPLGEAKRPPEPPVQAFAAKSAAVVPFEYVLERQARDGSWSGIESTARLNENDQVRVALQANLEGIVSVDLQMPGGTTRPLLRTAAKPGMRLHIPAQGGLPAGRGEHRLVMGYVPGSGAPASMGFRQGGAAGAIENRARKAEAASRDEAAATPAAQPYSVEIPLRFR